MEKIGIIGSGIVATVLAKGFIKHGYNVELGSRDKTKLEKMQKETGASAGTFEEAVYLSESMRVRYQLSGFAKNELSL